MKIKKVTRIQGEGMDGLEVIIEDEGIEKVECFTDAEEALQEINGEPNFVKRIKENIQKAKEQNSEPELAKTKTEIKKFKDLEVVL